MNSESPTAPVGVAWRKSSYSTGTGNCVEVASTSDGVLLRHSRHPAAGAITFPHRAWTTFVRDAAEGLPGTNGVATIAGVGTDTLVTSLSTAVELRFDEGEWSAFLAGVAAGEFDFVGRAAV